MSMDHETLAILGWIAISLVVLAGIVGGVMLAARVLVAVIDVLADL